MTASDCRRRYFHANTPPVILAFSPSVILAFPPHSVILAFSPSVILDISNRGSSVVVFSFSHATKIKTGFLLSQE